MRSFVVFVAFKQGYVSCFHYTQFSLIGYRTWITKARRAFVECLRLRYDQARWWNVSIVVGSHRSYTYSHWRYCQGCRGCSSDSWCIRLLEKSVLNGDVGFLLSWTAEIQSRWHIQVCSALYAPPLPSLLHPAQPPKGIIVRFSSTPYYLGRRFSFSTSCYHFICTARCL